MPGEVEKLGFQGVLDALSLEARGVVYAGAHRGEHIAELRECGFQHMLLIEPNADDFEVLDSYKSEHVRCVRVALNDRVGPVSYWAAPGRFAIMNSILEPDHEHFARLFERTAKQSIEFEKREVEATTLDVLLATDPTPYNLFYLNVQGNVLPALKGARTVLSRFEVIVCEAELVSRYRGAPLFDELKAWLSEQGFELRGESRSEDPDNDFGMACFARRR